MAIKISNSLAGSHVLHNRHAERRKYFENEIKQAKSEVIKRFKEFQIKLEQRKTQLLKELDEIPINFESNLNQFELISNKFIAAKEKIISECQLNPLNTFLKYQYANIDREFTQHHQSNIIELPEIQIECNSFDKSLENIRIKRFPRPYILNQCPIWETQSISLTSPRGIAYDKWTKMIYVADCYNHSIKIFDEKVNHLKTLQSVDCNSQIELPIAIDTNQHSIYVSSQHSVIQFNKKTFWMIASYNASNNVYGINCHHEDTVYACVEPHLIVVLNSNLILVKTIEIYSPYIDHKTKLSDIKIRNNNMYILLQYSPQYHIQQFTLEGTFVKGYIDKNYIQHACFFTIDRFDNFLISDYTAHQVVLFDRRGEYIFSLYQKTNSKGPFGIDINSFGRVIISHW